MGCIPTDIGYDIHCDVVEHETDDSDMAVNNKAILLKRLLDRSLNDLKNDKVSDKEKLQIVSRLNRLSVSPQSMSKISEQYSWLQNKKGHLCYLTVVLSQLAIKTSHVDLRELILTVLTTISTELHIPN